MSNISDEPVINFTNEYGVQRAYTIEELVGGRPTCLDHEYLKRITICKSCDSCVGNELCTENNQLVRMYCRLADSGCPLKKW